MRTRTVAVLFGPVAWLLSAAGVVLAVAPTSPALQPVSDPHGMFTIDFPATWQIESQELRRSAIRGRLPDGGLVSVVSGVAADRRTRLTALAKVLKKPLSARALAEASPLEPQTDETLTVVQKGPTRVDGRTAYYQYVTVDSPSGGVGTYDVVVHVVAGRVGFMLWGITTRDDWHMDHALPLVLRLIETFHVGKVPDLPKASSGFGLFP